MKGLLNPDNPVMNMITKIAYSAYLNILWFICCLPIVTIGASTTALFSVTQKMAEDEEGALTKQFFKAFKENFRQSTVVWLILAVVGAVLAVDGYVLFRLRFENAFWTVITAVFCVALAAYAIIVMWIFPLMAHFENTTFMMFKNSIMVGMRFLICTALMACVYFAMLLIVVRFFTPAVVFGVGTCAYVCSCLMRHILVLCEGKTEEQVEAEQV